MKRVLAIFLILFDIGMTLIVSSKIIPYINTESLAMIFPFFVLMWWGAIWSGALIWILWGTVN